MLKSRQKLTGPSLALLLATLLLGACSDDDEDWEISEPDTGTLELNWSIGGEADPNHCARFGVAAAHVALTDHGYLVDRFEFPCQEFSGVAKLFVGTYAARVTLVDSAHFRVTDRTVTTSFILHRGEQEVIDVDFPESSFFKSPSTSGGAGAGGEAPGSAGSPDATAAGGTAGVAPNGGASE